MIGHCRLPGNDCEPDGQLPIIWDADFLYGPKTPSGDDSYVLCEINVSAVRIANYKGGGQRDKKMTPHASLCPRASV